MNTKQKTIILDLDGTVTTQSTWFELNTAFGITPEQDEELFRQYHEGTLSYTDWNQQLVELYRSSSTPQTRSDLEQLADRIELRPDATAFVQTAKEKGYSVVLVSGSVDVLVERIATRLGTDAWLACSQAIFENEVLTDVVSLGDEGQAKIKLVEEVGIELTKETISIGDGSNDIELFTRTTGIMLGDNQALQAVAKQRVDSLREAISLI